MAEPTTIDLGHRGLSPAETVRHMGWGVGTLLVGDEGYGPSVIEITAVGHHSILARAVEQKGKPIRTSESMWVLDAREWIGVAPAPQTTPQDAREGGKEGLEGVPGGERTSEGAGGAAVRSLGWRLRDEAHNLGIPRLREWGDEADHLLLGMQRISAANVRLAADLDEAQRALAAHKETFREITDGKPMAEWHAEHCGAVEGADQMRRERDQARGDLAAQEGIAQEMQKQLREAHTSLLTAVEGNTPLVKRAEEAEATVERVRAQAARWDERVGTPLGRISVGNAAFAIRRALDGGTEADRG